MSHRADQIASTIQRAVQIVLARGLQDPRVRGLISVTKVQLDGDLSGAVVHVSVLPGEHGPLSIRGLTHAAARIRSEISGVLRMRRVPRLRFHLDESIKKQAAFEAALAEGRRGDEVPSEPEQVE